MSSSNRHINFTILRDRVMRQQKRSGKDFWRSLDELNDTPEFQEFVEREFPQHAEEWNDPVERRTFLKLMGASLALAGLTGCAIQPEEKAIPNVRGDADVVPGKPLFYATAMPFAGGATPLLVRSNEGRPTKIEGNNLHPASQGATDLWAQGSLLTMFDPDRATTITFRNDIRTWGNFKTEVANLLSQQQGKQGAGLRFLTETVTSPTLTDQLRGVLAAYPQAKWYQYEPVGSGNAAAGVQLAFGQSASVVYDFSKADRIFSIGSDFLAAQPNTLKYARDYADKRAVDKADGETREMNRLYVVENTPSLTGLKADHRLGLKPSQMEDFVRAVASGVGVGGAGGNAGTYGAWINALATDLKTKAGASIVIVGDEQPPVIHALALALNETLGNVGKTVFVNDTIAGAASDDPAQWRDQMAQIRELTGELNAGKVEILVVIGGNPVYDAPADLGFADAYQKAGTRICLSLFKDETAELSQWHIPMTHYLEMWGDARAYDGTVTIIQPLIAPLYGGCKMPLELVGAFSRETDKSPLDVLRAYWGRSITTDFDKTWRKALNDGFLPNTTAKAKAGLKVNAAAFATPTPRPQVNSPIEIIYRYDPTIYDGRFANNGWLQELPKPISKLTWDNVALMSPATAARVMQYDKNDNGVKGGNWNVGKLNVTVDGRTKQVPVWVQPGQPDDVVTLYLGYGRRSAGRVGNGVGYNAYELRTSTAPWEAYGVSLEKAVGTYPLATTQLHFTMENRNVVREAPIEKYLENGHEVIHGEEEKPGVEDSLYAPGHNYKDQSQQPGAKHTYNYAWGMTIDVSRCTGCTACVIACQSENNIAVVGKEQVMRSREMHWLRVDTYYKGTENVPEDPNHAHFMPMPCQQCENAPCETVCPVHATAHSSEGLNDMVYNRCVGTRYCSNNCPYKVRRFNFLRYTDYETPTYQIMRNPEVSVRSRGVMEKCTYCVQRIQGAKIESEKEGRPVQDGEIVTACQAVCPTNAIVFGDVNDPNSRVSKLKAEQRNYTILDDLNTQPRTSYLAALRNPNSALGGTEVHPPDAKSPSTENEAH